MYSGREHGSKKKNSPPPHTLKKDSPWQEIAMQLSTEKCKVRALLAAASEPLMDNEQAAAYQQCEGLPTSEMRQLAYEYRGVLLHRLHLINDALQRIAFNTYGRCIQCGVKINARRLAADVAVARCVRCQAEVEEDPLPPHLLRYLHR
jgi:RNA polymerase-binding transcription factor DksA